MLYRILLFVHVLAAIYWLGAGVLFQIMVERTVKLDDVSRMKSFVQVGSLVPSAFFGVLTAIVLGAGIWLVIETGFGFEEPFVVGGIIGIVISGALGGAVIGRTVESLRVAVESPTIDASSIRSGMVRLRNVGRLDVAVMVAVVFLMTAKPGT